MHTSDGASAPVPPPATLTSVVFSNANVPERVAVPVVLAKSIVRLPAVPVEFTVMPREKLPERLTRNQSVHNIGRAALLVAAMTLRRYDLLPHPPCVVRPVKRNKSWQARHRLKMSSSRAG